MLLIAFTLPLMGCGYGPVSATGYEYAKALYALANRESADRVDAVDEQITAAREAGELPSREAEWLSDICDQCRNGDWKAAQREARWIMEDQVRVR